VGVQEQPTGRPEDPTSDERFLELAHRVFDMARHGATAQLAEYLDAGVPVNLTNDKGDSLLMLAAYHEHPETVRALLARGADPCRVNDRGQTPLAAAVFRKMPDMVTALLEAGADPSQGSPSAREAARFFDMPEMLALLDSASRGDPAP
jgi:ankyrin repeat protein